jgi:hypothetical protein
VDRSTASVKDELAVEAERIAAFHGAETAALRIATTAGRVSQVT